MVKLLHLTSNLDDVLAAGEVKGHPNHYDIERGVSKDLTVIFGQVVHDGACCSHLGDTLQLDMKVLESVSDRWHLAYPEACRFRLGGEHKFFQLYLVPHNNPLFAQGLEKFGGDEVDALGNLGLDYICSVTADALPQALESQLVHLDYATQHLHAIICLDTLPINLTTESQADTTTADVSDKAAAASSSDAGGGVGVGAKSCSEAAGGHPHVHEGALQKVLENAAMHQVV